MNPPLNCLGAVTRRWMAVLPEGLFQVVLLCPSRTNKTTISIGLGCVEGADKVGCLREIDSLFCCLWLLMLYFYCLGLLIPPDSLNLLLYILCHRNIPISSYTSLRNSVFTNFSHYLTLLLANEPLGRGLSWMLPYAKPLSYSPVDIILASHIITASLYLITGP